MDNPKKREPISVSGDVIVWGIKAWQDGAYSINIGLGTYKNEQFGYYSPSAEIKLSKDYFEQNPSAVLPQERDVLNVYGKFTFKDFLDKKTGKTRAQLVMFNPHFTVAGKVAQKKIANADDDISF